MKLFTLFFFTFCGFCFVKGEENEGLNITDDKNNNINDTNGIDKEDEERIKESKKELELYFKSLETVPKLTDENFTNFTESIPFTLLYFHSPSECLDCQEINKEIAIANDLLTHLDTPRQIVHIDVSDSENTKKINKIFPVDNLPQILLYSSLMDKYLKFVGPYNSKGFFTFVTKNSANSLVINITDSKDIKSFLSPLTTYMAVVNFNENITQNIRNVSSKIPFVLFGNCFSELCKQILLPKSDIQIVKTFESGNSKESIISVNFTDNETLIKNIMFNSLPRVGNLSSFATEVIYSSFACSIIYVRAKNEKLENKEIEKILKSGIYLDNNINITYGFILDPMDNNDDYSILKLFGFSVDDYENDSIIFIIKFDFDDQYEIYEMKEKNKNDNNVKLFVESFLKGEIKKNLKSESIPFRQPSENVRIIVGKNFKEEIMERNNASFLLAFYSIGCKKCQILEQIIWNYSLTYENDTDIVFGITDFMANDIPNVNSSELYIEPIVRYYYKDKSKGYEDYKGEFTVDSIKEWFSKFYNKEEKRENKVKEDKKEEKIEDNKEDKKESDL